MSPNLAICVAGNLDPSFVLFKTLEAFYIVQNFYTSSLIISTLTDQLLQLFVLVFMTSKTDVQIQSASSRSLQKPPGPLSG
jgi:hypothetical protein